MATYYSKKHGFEFSMPDDATSEQINVEWRRRTQEVEAKQRESGAARAGVRQEQADAARQEAQAGGMVPPETPQEETPGLLEWLGRTAAGPLAQPGYGFGEPDPEQTGRAQRGFLRHAPTIAAGTAGGAALGPAVGAVGRAVTPVAGRLAGAGASMLSRLLGGEALLEGSEAVGAALTGEDPMEAARQVRGYGAAGEVLGAGAAGVARGVSKLRRGGWLKKSVSPAGQEAMEVLGPGGVRPAQAVEGTGLARAADIADAAAGSAMFGGGGMEVAQKTQQAVLRGKLDDFIDEFGQRTTLREAGESVRGALKGRKEAFHAYGDSVAKEISADIGNRAVPLNRTYAVMEKALRETPDPQAVAILNRLKEITTAETQTGRQVTETIAGAGGVTTKAGKEVGRKVGEGTVAQLGETITREAGETGLAEGVTERARLTQKTAERVAKNDIPFEQAHGILKYLNRLDEPTGVAKQLRKALWQDMTEAVADNPTARQKWVELGSYWKTGGKTFNQDYVKRILEKADLTDVQVVRSFLADRDPKQVMQIKNLVGKDTWRQVESSFAQDLIGTATSEAGETLATKAAEEMAGVSGKVLRRQIEKTYGPSTVAAVLGDEAAANLSKLARVLETTQAKGVSSGRLFIQMKQAGAVTALAGLTGGLVTGDPSTGLQVGLTAGGIWIGGPLLLSKIMTSPKASQYLLEGVAAKPGSGEMTRAVTRLNVYLAGIAKGRETKKAPEAYPWDVTP